MQTEDNLTTLKDGTVRRSYKGSNNPNYGKVATTEKKQKISQGVKESNGYKPNQPKPLNQIKKWEGKNNHNYGRVVSDNEKQLLRDRTKVMHELTMQIQKLTGHGFFEAQMIACQINKTLTNNPKELE